MFRNNFLKSLTTVTVNRFFFIFYFKSSNVSLILLRKNRNCLDGVEYQVVPSFFSLSSNRRRILLIRCGVYSRAAFIDHFDPICGVYSNKYGRLVIILPY